MDRDELSKIGFNTSLESDPRRVMVQTEVVGRAMAEFAPELQSIKPELSLVEEEMGLK